MYLKSEQYEFLAAMDLKLELDQEQEEGPLGPTTTHHPHPPEGETNGLRSDGPLFSFIIGVTDILDSHGQTKIRVYQPKELFY